MIPQIQQVTAGSTQSVLVHTQVMVGSTPSVLVHTQVMVGSTQSVLVHTQVIVGSTQSVLVHTQVITGSTQSVLVHACRQKVSEKEQTCTVRSRFVFVDSSWNWLGFFSFFLSFKSAYSSVADSGFFFFLLFFLFFSSFKSAYPSVTVQQKL